MLIILLVTVTVLCFCFGGLLSWITHGRPAIESVDTRALDNPPLRPETLTGQAYFDWEHSIPNPYEQVKHLPGQGCIRCYPPPRGSLRVTSPAPRTHAITNTPATPLYRQGGSDLSISVAPMGLVDSEARSRAEAQAKEKRIRHILDMRVLAVAEHYKAHPEDLTSEEIARMPLEVYTAVRAQLLEFRQTTSPNHTPVDYTSRDYASLRASALGTEEHP